MKDIRKLIEDISKEYGLTPIIVETITKSTTDVVVESIGGCHAFLQVVSLKRGEELERVNFSWLSFEHGVAAGKNLPTVRMVDRVHGKLEEWVKKLNIERDDSLLEFYSDAVSDDLASLIRKDIGQLANELLSRRQARG